jgi:seryl-tRNA synthetase
MLDIKFIRENPETVKQALAKRGADIDIERVLVLDKHKRELIQEVESIRAEKNRISQGAAPSPEEREKASQIKKELKNKEKELDKSIKEFESLFMLIPNIPLPDVPQGQSEEDNVVVKKWGRVPKFDFKPKNHMAIGKDLDLIDIERAAKISGTRFGILKNEAVLLQFALINFCFDLLLPEGFVPLLPPALIKPESMEGTGHIDTEEDLQERYYLNKEELFLIGTAEQSIGPLHQGEAFEEKDLPKRYLAFSPCFREEAGSYGKDTRGIFRVHQFDKIEMFSFVKPEESSQEHQFLLQLTEKLMQKLELSYQLVHLCAGDMARPSVSTFDIETWFPSEEKYRETQSISNCTDFQTRRMEIKYKRAQGTEFVHTLNATALAMGRTIIAILENYQQEDGTVAMPKALKKYLSFQQIPQK